MPSPPANTLDRRLHVYRDDVADARLRDQVTAARYIEGHAYKIVADIAPVHPKPLRDTNLDTQAFYGEAVTVFEIENGLAWSQLSRDGYVGYIPFDCVAVDTSGIATHKVAAPQTFIYSDADAAAKPLGALALGTTFRVERETDRFVEVTYRSITGYVSKWHLEPIDAVTPDYVATAMMFLRTPYLWGGKSARGIDCSGLVQVSLQRAGIDCLRDTDMQERALPGGIEIDGAILERLQRGDIVYWPGHVGIMIDESNMIHASGTLAATEIEPIASVAERSRKGGPVVRAVKRLMT